MLEEQVGKENYDANAWNRDHLLYRKDRYQRRTGKIEKSLRLFQNNFK